MKSEYDGDDEIELLVGQTLSAVEGLDTGSDEVFFFTELGKKFRFFHHQDCCESVLIEEIHGEVKDLIGAPLLRAEVESSENPPEDIQKQRDEARAQAERDDEYYYDSVDSETWTFYKFATLKGEVTIRWLGSSNGYYSERVTFHDVTDGYEE